MHTMSKSLSDTAAVVDHLLIHPVFAQQSSTHPHGRHEIATASAAVRPYPVKTDQTCPFSQSVNRHLYHALQRNVPKQCLPRSDPRTVYAKFFVCERVLFTTSTSFERDVMVISKQQFPVSSFLFNWCEHDRPHILSLPCPSLVLLLYPRHVPS